MLPLSMIFNPLSDAFPAPLERWRAAIRLYVSRQLAVIRDADKGHERGLKFNTAMTFACGVRMPAAVVAPRRLTGPLTFKARTRTSSASRLAVIRTETMPRIERRLPRRRVSRCRIIAPRFRDHVDGVGDCRRQRSNLRFSPPAIPAGGAGDVDAGMSVTTLARRASPWRRDRWRRWRSRHCTRPVTRPITCA
jgi:hypothetical protein